MSFDLRIKDGDLSIGPDGDFEKIEGTDKLIQDLLKICLTPLGSNKFYPWYGCQVSRSLIGQAFDFEMMANLSSNQLQSSIEMLQKLQQIQAKTQVVSPSEMIAAIKKVEINRNRFDLRFFEILVEVVNRAFGVVDTSFSIRPGL